MRRALALHAIGPHIAEQVALQLIHRKAEQRALRVELGSASVTIKSA